MECGGEGEKIPSGLPCPDCPSKPAGVLRRHDYYLRNFKTDVVDTKIKITRLCCSKCRITHACLFPCLIPHSRYSAEYVGKLVAPYFVEQKSCEQIGWEGTEEEGEGHRHLVHEKVTRICEKQDWIANVAEKEEQKSGESLWKRKEPEPEGECPNGRKVKSEGKKKALTRVRAALVKLRERTGQELEALIGLLHETSMQLSAPVSLLSLAKVSVVRTTHKWGNALF